MYLTSEIVKGYASSAALPHARAPRRTARARGADPVASHHRELRKGVTAFGAIPPRTLPSSGRALSTRVNRCCFGASHGKVSK
jgi:hypothetical protein